ncbi:helix-turn-helix domain-containing protein [Actinomadura rayongensis]|uniref:PucR family transcriptional regulator n=1 Tax=Actinomadura rayongensis TaxID=1429076 RepID=A0A6I4WAW9_9ACTN|nr:PucR family transcriptional regulator [Actinomadura rayongensis]
MTATTLDHRPFEAIPTWVGTRLRPVVEGAADELLGELLGRTDGPPGDAPPRPGSPHAERLRDGIVAGLAHFCDLLENPGTGWGRVASFYRAAGRQLARDGRDPIESHQTLRRSALAAWRGITSLADELDLDHDTLLRVVEAQFSYLDAVSAVVAEGYRAECGDAARDERLRRARLLALLLADPVGDQGTIETLATQARWPLPSTVAAVAVAPRPGQVGRDDTGTFRPPLAVPDELLADQGMPEPSLLLPDPEAPGRAALLDPLTQDWIVAVGPTVPLPRARESLRWARDTLVLARRGAFPVDRPVRSADHLPSLVVFRAGELIDDAATTRLAPLSGLAPAQRDRLTETLQALLEHNFNAAQASRRLRVHPQTVRYRLRQLEDLFGDDLRDPRRCLEMELILHARYATSDSAPAEVEHAVP